MWALQKKLCKHFNEKMSGLIVTVDRFIFSSKYEKVS